MERPVTGITRRRAFALALTIFLIFSLFSLRLFRVEIIEGKSYAELASKSSGITVPITASRGEILDRYLRPMVVNRTSFSIVFDYAFFPHGKSDADQKKENDILLSLTDLLSSEGNTWNDTLPITKTAPYSFEEGRDNSVSNLKSNYRLSESADTGQCIAALVDKYKLGGYTPEQQRTILGVRYEIDIRDFSLTNPFIFSSDITEDTYNVILENNTKYPGVNVQTSPVRQYVNGTLAPHLMGTVGPIFAEEYANLKDKGYLLSDTVGKSGIESLMESSLRGKNGVSTIVKDTDGNVVEKRVTTEPVPGSSVILTLDSKLQQTAQDALDSTIRQLRSQVSGQLVGQDVRSGSVVMLDVKTGGVLVCASWPGYDLSTYNTDYSQLIGNPDKPLYNRALQGAFACGSTIKPGVALAGLTEGVITPSSTLADCAPSPRGDYKYYGNDMYCWNAHGHLTVVPAIAQSCDVFFYDLGRLLGISRLNEYYAQFGLGQKTGIELGESAGVLDSPSYRASKNEPWYPSFTSYCAIGQASNLFTPIQLASYTMTIADNGVRYKTHIIKNVRSYDGRETPVQPEITATIPLSQQAVDTVREGMIDVVRSENGTAHNDFKGIDYALAAKTGTAQVSKDRSDHGVFIGYAPADNPEVAIAVVLEDGTSHPAARVARAVLDAYFTSKKTGQTPTPEAELLP